MDINKLKLEIKRILEPIKASIINGKISEEMAMDLLSKQLGNFSGKGNTLDYKKFKENCNLIYEKEPFLDIGYRLETGRVYKFLPASQHDVHTLYKIWQHLGSKEYESPGELKEVMYLLLNLDTSFEIKSQ